MQPNRIQAWRFAVVLALLTWPWPAVAADECCAAAERRTITVNGRGEVSVTADLAVIALAVETTNARADAAVTENAERSSRVASAVKRLLGKDDEVSTTRYSLQPRYEHRKGEDEPHITGYVASNEVRVELHDVNAVGEVIDAAIQAGANRIGSLSFTVEDPDPAQRRALELAGQRAREQAETMAAAIGVKLGAVISANAGYPQAPMPRRMESFAAMARDSMPKTPIEAGDVTVNAEVNVVYEIE